MKKKHSPISGLLAARPRALRRPPHAAPSQSPEIASTGHLRLVADDHAAASSASKPRLTAAPEPLAARDAVAALQAASASLAGIHALIMDVVDRMNAGRSPARRSPREISEVQALIDRTVRDIDRIVESNTFRGRLLLDGYFKTELPSDAGCPARRIAIRSMYAASLGPDAARSLIALRTGGSHSLMVASFDDAATILRHAAGQVAMARHHLVGAGLPPAQADSSNGDVARENAAAANNANLDLDFAAVTSQLTPGVTLAASLASKSRPTPPPSGPSLTLHRE